MKARLILAICAFYLACSILNFDLNMLDWDYMVRSTYLLMSLCCVIGGATFLIGRKKPK